MGKEKDNKKKGFLRLAFAAALVGCATLVPAQRAMAFEVVEDTAAVTADTAVEETAINTAEIEAENAAINAAEQEAIQSAELTAINSAEVSAINDAVQSPKLTKALNTLTDDNVITLQQQQFFLPAILYLNLQNNQGRKLTDAQKNKLLATVQHMQTTAEVSSKTPRAAVKLGLSSSLAPYFNTCKAQTGVTGAKMTYKLASKAVSCMQQQHFEKDVKPQLILGGEIGGGLLLLGAAGAAAAAVRRKRKYGF